MFHVFLFFFCFLFHLLFSLLKGPGSTTEFVNEVVSTIYAITQQPALLQEYYDVITGILLRTLVELTACQNGKFMHKIFR